MAKLIMLGGHDPETHMIEQKPNGDIRIVSRDDNKVDNPHGPALVTAAGDAKYFLNGSPVSHSDHLAAKEHEIERHALG